MKAKNIINKLFLGGALLCTGVMSSCEDYLTILPTGSIPEENFWQNKSDLDNVRAAAYYQMSRKGVTSRILYWGELRSDNVELKDMSNTAVKNLMEGVLQPVQGMFQWNDFYSGISYCNKVLENGDRMIKNDIDPTFSVGEWNPIKAEMKALRALYYFYLVRAYRDVPYITNTISTDAEALQARQGQPALQGVAILDSLIKDLEECKGYAAKNFGNELDNKGRFNKRSIRMLLADIYLWQACLLQHGIAKGYVVNNADGVAITAQSELGALSQQYLQRSIDLCNEVLYGADGVEGIMEEYNEYRELNNSYLNKQEREQEYPLYRITRVGGSTADLVYNTIWGEGDSRESILDIQFNGTNNVNSVLPDMYLNASNKSGKLVVAKPALFTSINSLDNDGSLKGFGKTDVRLLECVSYQGGMQSEYPIVKMSAERVSISDLENMAMGAELTIRDGNANDCNWPVYRLADLMLIKAEAIARLYPNDANTVDVREGFNLVNTLFERNNPGLDSTGTAGAINVSARLTKGYSNDKNGSALLELVYRERQREFFGEGKRWFDIVRQAESANATGDVLASWMGAGKSLQTRLRKLVSMYIPYYNEELKVNPSLKQNEVWDKYTPNSSKPTQN